MAKKSATSSVKPTAASSNKQTDESVGDVAPRDNVGGIRIPRRSAYVILALFFLVIWGCWNIHFYQFENLPLPLSADMAGKRGFSEVEAMKHVKALTKLGPHTVGSDALEHAVQYVYEEAKKIIEGAHWEVDVQVELFNVKSGANRLVSGLFKGKTLVYSDLNHVLLRILPKYSTDAEEKAILVSSHIDTVFAGEGAGDCSSCVSVMLELARGISHWAHGLKHSVIFLFNTGEEEGLNGAHSFMTQHPWSDTIHLAIDLEAMGIGGKSGIFQAGPHPWAIENYAMVAKYPSAQIVAQDLFSSGAIKSATDFQIYKEVGGLSGLDFAYTDNTAVYHTKNDKLKLLKPGSLQHLGDNMLAFLLHAAAHSHIPDGKEMEADQKDGRDSAIYFDILGTYMVTFRQSFANWLYSSLIAQSLLLWTTSLIMGGTSAVTSMALSFLSILFMWILSLCFSIPIAFILPLISSSPVPYVSTPLLAAGLFGPPALVGALTGQHLGFIILQKYIFKTFNVKRANLAPDVQADVSKLDAERWLYKAGLLQWLVFLIVGYYFKIGSTYIALVWLVSPAFAYGLLEATLSPARLPKPIKTVTLLMGQSLPFLISAGMLISLGNTLIGTTVRFDRNPGGTPEWLTNLVLAVYISAIICLTLVYLLSCVHYSGAKSPIVIISCILFGLSLAAVFSGIVPPFTDDVARAVNVVHVVDATSSYDGTQKPNMYISMFSTTPGKLTRESEEIGEGFVCGTDKVLDFVTFSVKYGCWASDDMGGGWDQSDIPTLLIENDTKGDDRIISIDTKTSSRWTLGINTQEIDDFKLKADSEELVPFGDKSTADGWHVIQFSGGKNAHRKFDLTLHLVKNYTKVAEGVKTERPLLKLRTDVDRLTPKTAKILGKLPSWCSLFGKSTSPHTLAFLSSLPVSIL